MSLGLKWLRQFVLVPYLVLRSPRIAFFHKKAGTSLGRQSSGEQMRILHLQQVRCSFFPSTPPQQTCAVWDQWEADSKFAGVCLCPVLASCS